MRASLAGGWDLLNCTKKSDRVNKIARAGSGCGHLLGKTISRSRVFCNLPSQTFLLNRVLGR